MNSNYPYVTIIIPTHNRCTLLPHTLDALSAQTYPAERMEIVLVADGCTDDTVVLARQYAAPCKLNVLDQPALGPSAARNLGAAHAQGEVLIFLDDDMQVVPEFVAAHASMHQDHLQTVVIGTFSTTHHMNTYFGRSLSGWYERSFFQMREPGYRFRYSDFFGGNFSVRADFFARIGGFDPELWCHEDYEIGVRLLEAGAVCRLAVAAAANHDDATDINRALKRKVAEGQADVYLALRHAGLHELSPLALPPYTFMIRILRFLAFRYPSIGNRLAEAFKRVLPVLEFFWLFRFWQGLLDHLLDYWYWRGVATIAQPQMIRKMFSARYSHSPKILLDLAPGIDAAQHHLDRTRPTSASIFVGMNWVGDIPDFPGMERLRGEHLSRILATEMSGRLSMALSLAKLIPEQEWRFLTESEKLILRYGETHRSKKIVEIELSNGIPDIDVTGFDGLHALVRIHGQPLGCVTFSVQNETRIPTMALHQSIMSYLGWEAIPYVLGTPPSVCTTWPPISVIVCTRNRTSQLAGCLQALLELDYPRYEILVIDNAPSDDRTARLAAHLPVRYIREEQPGLGWARNRGLREAHHSIVAFIDEDAQADRGWLRAIAQTFNDPEVMAVTGSVLPAKLETQAQNLFEFGYGGMNHGFRRRIFRRANSNDAQLLWASRYGAGTNMAFRKSLFDELGSFDVALGVGTPSGGGGDVEMLYRVVARGYTLVYEPAALVWHTHRPQMSDLEKLVRNNGQSFGCFLLTCARNRTVSKAAILGFALHSWLWGWIGKRLVQPGSSGFPKRLVWLELMAALGSPFAYLRSQAHARRQSHRSESKIGVKYLTTEKGTR